MDSSERSGSVRQASLAEQKSPGGRFAEPGRVQYIVKSIEGGVRNVCREYFGV